MTTEAPSVYEILDINRTKKQINLTAKFEQYAKNIWLDEKMTQLARMEITRRLQGINNNNLDQKWFDRIANSIGETIDYDIADAKTKITQSSQALKGTLKAINPQTVEQSTAIPIVEPKAPPSIVSTLENRNLELRRASSY